MSNQSEERIKNGMSYGEFDAPKSPLLSVSKTHCDDAQATRLAFFNLLPGPQIKECTCAPLIIQNLSYRRALEQIESKQQNVFPRC